MAVHVVSGGCPARADLDSLRALAAAHGLELIVPGPDELVLRSRYGPEAERLRGTRFSKAAAFRVVARASAAAASSARLPASGDGTIPGTGRQSLTGREGD